MPCFWSIEAPLALGGRGYKSFAELSSLSKGEIMLEEDLFNHGIIERRDLTHPEHNKCNCDFREHSWGSSYRWIWSMLLCELIYTILMTNTTHCRNSIILRISDSVQGSFPSTGVQYDILVIKNLEEHQSNYVLQEEGNHLEKRLYSDCSERGKLIDPLGK